MKNTIICFIGLFAFYSSAESIWSGKGMGLKEVCKRWGEEEFNLSDFKTAGREGKSKRAKMTCSLIRNKEKYIGKDVLDIRKLFGDYSGYYFSGVYPTYLIESAKKHGEDSWQIVFLIDNEKKIKNIVVHKNGSGLLKDLM